MRLIDADYLIEDRVSNDPVVIAAKCAPNIDAIPLEWMEAQDNIAVKATLAIWQKEQEGEHVE